MNFDTKSVMSTPEVLKRKLGGELFVPVTIADSEFASADIVKAGNAIDASGKVVKNGTAIGILLNDVEKENPNGSLIKAFATINVANCPSGAITEDVKGALPNIIFE